MDRQFMEARAVSQGTRTAPTKIKARIEARARDLHQQNPYVDLMFRLAIHTGRKIA
jgi:hypothetical protein